MLLRGFDSTGDIVSNPLESLSTRKTQAPLCQVRCKRSRPSNTRRPMNHDMVSCLCVGNRVLNCLFEIICGRHTEIGNRQIEHLKSRFEIQRSQIAACLVETLFVACQEDNDRKIPSFLHLYEGVLPWYPISFSTS